ncbi:MAG: bi-domain-containing oxidoreductase, partial [Cyclobacteriaceae bacterium]|nr:bi-domain-containing oxidoreductase [Cyclobacteriaceae bacterium]
MKQLIQNLKTGATTLEEIPAPTVRKGGVLIRTTHSLVSLGTERMLVEFGQANLIQKARQQPERVKMVLDKMKTDGILPTIEAVFNKLDQPLPLGYCNAGVVVQVGEGVNGIKVGDRVASNGPHAEYVCVPQNLVAVIPENVSNEEGAFTIISAIGLQGIRLANPTLGETVVVIGLGLIGLVTAQLLKANGCKVIGIDLDDNKLALAASFGIDTYNTSVGDVVKFVTESTAGVGADAVLITASSEGNEIISQAARMSRKRGRLILIGVIGLEINRAEFYEKELQFQVSCSYGPGRYDDNYEQQGNDYPLPFVRWTEKRNFEAVLQAMAGGQLQVKQLITEQVPLAEYLQIYGDMGKSAAIASLLQYPAEDKTELKHTINVSQRSFTHQKGVVGIIGAGNFTKMTLLPALKNTGAELKTIASANGITGTALAKKHAIANSTSSDKDILSDSEIDLVMITTRHNLHAGQVIDSLKAGKHVFVEKPLALNEEELNKIIAAYESANECTLNVGFNRRFSPHSEGVKKALSGGPINMVMTMNAGFIPPNSWVQDMKVGGGRIIGEACHFLDLCAYFADSPIAEVCMNAMGQAPEENTDNASILVRLANGSNAVINYFSNGSKAYAKERIEIFAQERTFVIDNWKETKGHGANNFKTIKSSIDKGHKAQFQKLIESVKQGKPSLIP